MSSRLHPKMLLCIEHFMELIDELILQPPCPHHHRTYALCISLGQFRAGSHRTQEETKHQLAFAQSFSCFINRWHFFQLGSHKTSTRQLCQTCPWHASTPLKLVRSDFCHVWFGSLPYASFSRFKYILTSIDDFSKHA